MSGRSNIFACGFLFVSILVRVLYVAYQWHKDDEKIQKIAEQIKDSTAFYAQTKPEYESLEYVDLALPSGNLWSKFDLGCHQYTDKVFYAWGETDPKNEYTADNYKWGTNFVLSKYKTQEQIKLEADDDAVAIRYGIDVHVPTWADFNELIKYCYIRDSSETDSVTGKEIKGIMLKSKSNGNHIFFPLRKYGEDYSGDYWLNQLRLDDKSEFPNVAKRVYLSSYLGKNHDIKISSCQRYKGLSIRPVKTVDGRYNPFIKNEE